MLICDEVDRFAEVVPGGEGEPVALAKRRLQTFSHNALTILASSPTLKKLSRIARHHARGDQRVFKVICRECGEADDLTPDRLKFEPGRPETGRLLCLCCGHRATEAERLAMLERGAWHATAIGEPGVASFHMGELASEFSTLETVAAAVDKAVSLEAKKVLRNTTYALPWESEAEAEIDPSDLEQRAIPVGAPYSAAIDFITAGVDVHPNRLECTILAHSAIELTVIDHIKLYDDATGPKPWDDLDAVLSSTFATADKRTLKIAATFVDAGTLTQQVADFVAKQPARGRKAWSIFGRGGFDRPTLKQGQRVRGLGRSYILGVDNIKLAVVKALSPDAFRPIRLPNHLDADYFVQMTNERLEVRYVKGQAKYVWVRERHARNEALDCLVYAFAAAGVVPGRADPKPAQDAANSMVESLLRMNKNQNGGQSHGSYQG